MDEWTNGRMDEWTNGRMDEWTNGQMDKWTNGRMDEWTNGRTDEWTNGRTDEWATVAVSAMQAGWQVEENAMAGAYARGSLLPKAGMALALTEGMADRAWIDALEERTKRFALSVIPIVRVGRRQPELWSALKQLNDAAGSVASNHRAVGRARSDREFAAKLQTVCEESDESAHWLAVIKETNRDATLNETLARALQEATELKKIFNKSRSTTRDRYFPETRRPPKRG